MKKTVDELFKGLDCRVSGGETAVTGISIDSRTVEKGDLFFGCAGDHADGAAFVCEAAARGAAAVCVPEHTDHSDSFSLGCVRTADPRRLLGSVSDRFWENPSGRIRLIGITGTNGKTSAAWFLQHILTSAGIRAGLTGTVENRFEENRYPQHLTTPEVHEFNHLLHLMRSQGAEYVVSEVSSQGIDKGRIDGLVFSQALFTNLSGEHLDYHLTMEDYFTAKRKLFDSVSEQGFSVVNRDDTYGQRLCEELETARTVSLEGDAYVSGRIRRQSSDGTDLEIACGDERGEVTVSRPGRFNCMNYLIAAASALCAGVSFSQVLNAGSTLPVVPGRIEEVETGCNFRVYVDYAHTDNALENVLSSLREFTAGRIITVFGAGGDRDRRKRPRMGKAAVEYSDCAIITSDNPRTEDPDSIISDILAGTDGREYASVRDRKEAIFRALETAGEGDAVIIAGKGHEDYQIVGTEKTHFSDAETVRDYFMNKAEQV